MTRRRSDGSGTGKDEPGDLTDMERALLAEGRRRITVRDGDEAREMSMNEIVTRKTAETAIKGSPHAQRTWFQVHAAAEARAAAIREKGAEFWRMADIDSAQLKADGIYRGINFGPGDIVPGVSFRGSAPGWSLDAATSVSGGGLRVRTRSRIIART